MNQIATTHKGFYSTTTTTSIFIAFKQVHAYSKTSIESTSRKEKYILVYKVNFSKRSILI